MPFEQPCFIYIQIVGDEFPFNLRRFTVAIDDLAQLALVESEFPCDLVLSNTELEDLQLEIRVHGYFSNKTCLWTEGLPYCSSFPSRIVVIAVVIRGLGLHAIQNHAQ